MVLFSGTHILKLSMEQKNEAGKTAHGRHRPHIARPPHSIGIFNW